MKKIVFQLIPAILSILLFNGCHRCHDKQYPDTNFTQQDLAIVPYTGQENLQFRDSSGTTLTFNWKDRWSERILNYSNDPDGDELLLYRCYGNYYYSERTFFNFKNTQEGYFYVELDFNNQFRAHYLEKQIGFNIYSKSPMPKIWFGYATYGFNADSIYTCKEYPANKVLAKYDSAQFGGQYYHKVYQLGSGENHCFYYSIKEGLVAIKPDSVSFFYIVK